MFNSNRLHCHHHHYLKFSYLLWMFVQSPFPHMKRCKWKSECYVQIWTKILQFFFLFVRPGWIHSPSYLPEWLFHTCLLTLHKLLSLPSPFHSQVIVFLHFAEAIEAIKNGFPEAPITTSIHTISCVWMLLRE